MIVGFWSTGISPTLTKQKGRIVPPKGGGLQTSKAGWGNAETYCFLVVKHSKAAIPWVYVRAMLQAVHVCASNADSLLILLNLIPWCMYHTGQAHLSLIILRCEKKRCYVQIPFVPSSQVFAGWLGFSHSHLETLNTHAKQCFKSGCSQQSCG